MKKENITIDEIYRFKSKEKCREIFFKKWFMELDNIPLSNSKFMNPKILDKLYEQDVIVNKIYDDKIYDGVYITLKSNKSISHYVPSEFLKKVK